MGGNIDGNKNLRIMQYNKGNWDFENNIHNIQYILNKYDTDIICISGAYINNKSIFNINNFPWYNIIINKQYNQIGVSRKCIIIKDRIKFTKRGDPENDINIYIWVQIGIFQIWGGFFLEKYKSIKSPLHL